MELIILLIIVAEAVKQEDGDNSIVKFADGEERLGGIGTYIAHQIMQKSSAECRVTTLGHVQRGAPPTTQDRILASAFLEFMQLIYLPKKSLIEW